MVVVVVAAVSDRDHGFADLVKRVYGFERPRVVVGVLEGDKGSAPHGGDALTVLQVAIFNEFGTHTKDGRPHVPSRSFIRAWVDENRPTIRLWLRELMVSVLAGRRTKEQALELLAQKCVAGIRARIVAGIAPPLQQATIDRKGSSTPLIDTGQLSSSITYRIDR